MSEQEAQQLIEQLEAYQREVIVDRQSALDALVGAGLLTRDGQLTQAYAPSPEAGLLSRSRPL